jgi:methyl-accepting chemotaxis protein
MAELTGAVGQVAQGAEEQRGLLVDAAALGSQVASSATDMSADANEVASAASEASSVAKSGAERVGKTIDNIHRLKASIDGAGEAVAELGTRSKEIGKIVGVIRDIAAQTDLLALNAAIEAARAGEHGAGFAVVADEVRSLAARATAATKDISKLIVDVQEGVSQAVTAMNSGAADMQTGIGSASEAGEALTQILGSVEAVDERIRGIASRAVELRTSGERMVEQLESIRQVADQNSAAAEGMRTLSIGVEEAAGSIAAIAEENSASAEETSASAEAMSAQVEEIHASTVELGNMADALRTAIARFRLSSEDAAGDDLEEEERRAA